MILIWFTLQESSIGDGVTSAPLLKPILRSHFLLVFLALTLDITAEGPSRPGRRLRSKRRGPCSQPWVVLRNEVK